jgi:hypothetical protein
LAFECIFHKTKVSPSLTPIQLILFFAFDKLKLIKKRGRRSLSTNKQQDKGKKKNLQFQKKERKKNKQTQE